MKNLYEIEKEYIMLADQIIDAGGEVTEELGLALSINQDELQAKGRGYGFVIKTLESDIDIIDAEIKRLQSFKSSRNKAIERLKGSLSDAMQLFDIDKIETPTLKISFRKSESVFIENPELLDKNYVTVVRTESPNKVSIKDAIKRGETVVGAVIVSNLNLQIK